MSEVIDKLYDRYNALSEAKEKIKEHSSVYQETINNIKGNESEKMLAAQILSKFFKHFPHIQEEAFNAILDLCEDDNAKVRACAMRYLVSISKDVKQFQCKVIDILAQMMQLEEHRDYTTASWCILQLWKEDNLTVLKTLYAHIHTLNNNMTAREKCVEFVYKRLVRPISSQLTDVENAVVHESKKILQTDPSCEEIILILSTLSTSRYAKTLTGQLDLFNIILDIIDVEGEFDLRDEGSIDKILICTSKILPLLYDKIDSAKLVIYYTDQILPQWENIEKLHNGSLYQLQILKHLASITGNCGKLDNPSLHVVQIFDKLKLYMPQPPEEVDVTKMPNFEFSLVECLLYIFHKLAKQCPDFLTHDAEVLKDFRSRLVYFSRGVQGSLKALKMNDIQKLSLDHLNALKARLAPVLLGNINTLIKDLFFQPPMYKANISLSFSIMNQSSENVEEKESTKGDASNVSTTPLKRHVPITFGEDDSKRQRTGGDNIKIYTPPSGKFSRNLPSFDRRNSRNSRGKSGGNRGFGGNGVGGRGKRSWRN